MIQFHTYLKRVYKAITTEIVHDWISNTDDDRGILRRLDYAYGFDIIEGNPTKINPNDDNPNGLLRILKREQARFNNNPEIDYFVKRVEETCETIKKLHCLFLVASYEQFHQDTNTFLHRFYSQINDPAKGQTCILSGPKPFFRIRGLEHIKSSVDERIEFFHVPFDKRYLMGTYRYSIPGYPSLYCSSSLYCAWEEFGCKDIEKCGYSAYRIAQSIRVLDLRWKFNESKLKQLDDPTLLKHYLLRLPLIIACSMQVKAPSAKFVPEYIFSQQIFQWLMSQMRHDEKLNTTMGVLYTSTKEDLWQEICKRNNADDMTNYALLAFTSVTESAQYSETLASKLEARKPIIWDKPIPHRKSRYEILIDVEKELLAPRSSKYMPMSNYIYKK